MDVLRERLMGIVWLETETPKWRLRNELIINADIIQKRAHYSVTTLQTAKPRSQETNKRTNLYLAY